jgi:cytosolic carboxypeptidase protein 2/3
MSPGSPLPQLEFDSKFDSGNLACAIKISQYEYDLILQNDTNTLGYNQWFFFRVKHKHQQAMM